MYTYRYASVVSEHLWGHFLAGQKHTSVNDPLVEQAGGYGCPLRNPEDSETRKKGHKNEDPDKKDQTTSNISLKRVLEDQEPTKAMTQKQDIKQYLFRGCFKKRSHQTDKQTGPQRRSWVDVRRSNEKGQVPVMLNQCCVHSPLLYWKL